MGLHVFPSKKLPSQLSFDMIPHPLNFISGSQSATDRYVQTVQSVDQDSPIPSYLQESALEYRPTTSQQSYSLSSYGGHASSDIPGGSEFINTPSSLSSHSYPSTRLRHTSGRASAQHQGWSQFPFLAAPDPASAPDVASPYNAMVGSRASTRRYDSSQSPLVARRFTPPAAFGSASQSNIVDSNTNQNVLSFTGSLAVPRQTFPSVHEMSASPSYTQADEADIEYAQQRYGDKCCLYQCRFDLSGSPCNKWIVGDRTRILRHLRNHHHLRTGPAAPALCRWDKCTHTRPMKQENLSRHIVMHLGVKWECPHCRRLFSRDDAVHRHIERMVPGMNVTDAEVIPGYEARAINESQTRATRIT